MRDERGFTIIEVLVAAMILVVGLLGTLALVDGANEATTATKAREGGNNLQRELIELARAVPYEDLQPGQVVARIRERGLSDSAVGGDGWTVTRRGVRYTISVGVCSVDDPNDLQGTRVANRFCATGSGQTSAEQCAAILSPGGTGGNNPDCGTDANRDGEVDGLVAASQQCTGSCTAMPRDLTPDDYKRVVTLVRWDRGQGSRFAIQTSTIPNPGYAGGPRIKALTPENVIRDDGGTSQTFTATTSRPPAKTELYVDGALVSTCGGTTLVSTVWSCPWSYGDMAKTPDGTYVVTAKALDEYGTAGASRSTTLRLNRRLPLAVEGVVAGENRLHGIVEVAWRASRDGDIEKYEAYRVSGSTEQFVCGKPSQTTCYFTGSVNATTTFRVYAFDSDSAGQPRRSNVYGWFTAGATNQPPDAVSNLVATTSNGATILTWTAPNQSGNRPDVDFYRIYRRSPTTNPPSKPDVGWRYDTTGSGIETTFVDTETNGQQWDYWVTSVGLELAESTAVRVRR
ncbi:MAG TPA: prepilin-type N-terminal cleavage/methylation domain-containing protein [Solirubrobacteraceae bacterium]|jgi:prepilin-type N-terminal cleavage/methylation domain-containing protein|nr:prepilin-type N-terminal cleavage/methylation domain-containing protein [Solirubrobacteraceae bacterium]